MARTAKTKSISFTEEYFPEYEYLNKMKGASAYVCELVRKDMAEKNTIDELTKQLEKIQLEIKKLELNGNNDKPSA